jgi:hypothetical protein
VLCDYQVGAEIRRGSRGLPGIEAELGCGSISRSSQVAQWLPAIWKRASLHASALIARWSGILAGDARRFRSQLATGVLSVFERTSNCCH